MSQFDDYSPSSSRSRQISAASFVATLAANVDNPQMSSDAFRELVRNTLPIVDYPGGGDSASRHSRVASQFDDSSITR